MTMSMVGVFLVWLAAGPGVEVIAHRGESADAPENTMAAFRLGWERKVGAIELDVHLTRDGSLVVSHDPDTKRTAGVARAIRQSTLAEIRALDSGRWKGPAWAGERFPTLEEALRTIPEGARCFVEVKVGPEAVPARLDVVKRSGKRPEQLAIISFHAETRRRLPEIKAYYLADFRRDGKGGDWRPGLDALIGRARAMGADGLDLSSKGPIDREFVARVKGAGLGLYVWAVDDPVEARRLVAAGVDGITTNRAAWMKERLRE